MNTESRLMEMLVGYAAAHQHPFNIAVHLIGIPIIMLGVFIPLSWLSIDVGGIAITAAHVALLGLFLFYLTLDSLFAIVFLLLGIATAELAVRLGALPIPLSAGIAAAAFFGGYALQFIGHAIERSMPVLVRHPIQANLAAPFFTVVEVFALLGLRRELFTTLRSLVAARRDLESRET